jgi:tetratricopeptide (TPR) repeat protein
MLKSLRDRELIRREGDAWLAADDLDSLEIPDSVESLLSTRIDGLSASTKRVLQYASIVGRHFWSGVLADVLVRQPVDEELRDLLHGEIVRMLPESIVEGEKEFIFQNLMLQEVAYQGLLRGLRAEMHGAVARWLERQLGTHSAEADELIAFHYERSTNRALAAPYLERCALRARGRGALLDAYSLARRSLEVADGDSERLAFMTLVEDLATEIGDEDQWATILDELEALAEKRDDQESRAEAEYRRARFLVARGKLVMARKLARRALERLQEGDPSGRLGNVYSLLGRIYQQWGDYHAAKYHYSAALPLHQAAGDRSGEIELLDRLGLVEVDLDDFCRAIEYFDDVLIRCRQEGLRATEVHVLCHKATAFRWLGLYDEGVETVQQALDIAGRSGSASILATAELTLGSLLAARGDPEAEQRLDSAADRARRAGRPALEARAWLELAGIARDEEAETRAGRARQLAASTGLVHVDILARTRQAELALERGDVELADRLSASATRRLHRHGSIQGPEEVVLFVRSRVLAARGDPGGAAEFLAEAREQLREKAERIPDEATRRTFLEKVDPNPDILAAATEI